MIRPARNLTNEARVIGVKRHGEITIVVRVSRKEGTDGACATELLGELPPERFLGRLSRLDLPAGELPPAGVLLFRASASKKHVSISENDRGNNVHIFHLVTR